MPKKQACSVSTSAEAVARRNQEQMHERVESCSAAGPEAIYRRLIELESEWDLDRVMTAAGGGIVLAGLLLSRSSRRWLVIPALAGGFLLQRAWNGTCPTTAWLRERGLRTATEIADERSALRALLGRTAGAPGEVRENQPAAARQRATASGLTQDDIVETASGRIKRATQS